jgi:hypothetical protein
MGSGNASRIESSENGRPRLQVAGLGHVDPDFAALYLDRERADLNLLVESAGAGSAIEAPSMPGANQQLVAQRSESQRSTGARAPPVQRVNLPVDVAKGIGLPVDLCLDHPPRLELGGGRNSHESHTYFIVPQKGRGLAEAPKRLPRRARWVT